jgi:IS30 family transposase
VVPWQRGGNENDNGLLPQYLPRGRDLALYREEDLRTATEELNDRPNKALGLDTHAELLSALLGTHEC